MEIPSEILTSVVFLCVKITENGVERFEPCGTAFLVAIPSEANPEISYLYLVTAKHVIESTAGRELSVRLNGAKGGRMDILVGNVSWIVHPTDDDVDVAVINFVFEKSVEHGHKFLPAAIFLSAENIAKGDVQIGNEVFITGLFTQHHGKFANLPIVRVGNIAMLPDDKEKVAVHWHNAEIEAYLIEARSIGGLSGSPVFFREPYFKQNQETLQVTLGGAARIFLGGLVHGHWSINSTRIDELDEDERSLAEKNVNMGIAIVIPASKILEVLMQDSLKESRKQADMRRAENPPKPDIQF